IDEVRRRFIIPLWNCYSFFVTYANLDGYNPRTSPRVQPASDMDRWILSELHQLTSDVTRYLEDYDPASAARRAEEFVDRLSNWYIRRSRPRFWKPVQSAAGAHDADLDKLSAHQTLYTCLATLAKLLAPAMPFLAEELYQNLVRSVDSTAQESVHLADWPQADASLIDESLSEGMRLAVRVASMGRAARSKAGIPVRQPLAIAVVSVPSEEEHNNLPYIKALVEDELNIKQIKDVREIGGAFQVQLRPNLPLLGPKYGRRIPEIQKALSSIDKTDIALRVERGQHVNVGDFTLLPSELLITWTPAEGYALSSEVGYVVAVDTRVTPELADEGLARELVHRIQNMRRSAGFDIADRITVWYEGGANISRVAQKHADYIKAETLTVDLCQGSPEADTYVEEQDVEGVKVRLGVRRG
ncbi:MAG: class I tRNA ligase family protein, partial [Chloroflexi bacterium]|nr:class I tRNA ligase family protein [Chloroflexota bacterium]